MSINTTVKIRIKHLIWLHCFLLLFYNSVAFAVISRNIDPAGSIVSTKGQEHIRLVTEQQWLKAEVTQTLTSGDALKTGRYGGLAILFRDETQIRIHNNSFLLIKDIAKKKQKNNTLLKLDYGRIWMRAITQPDKLQVETPSASLAVRGTDWAVTVNQNGHSQLVVLEGEIRFFNAQGSIIVKQGEAAIAEIGKPPRKIFLIEPKDKPHWNLILTAEWVELFLSSDKNSKQLNALRDSKEKQALNQQSIKNLLELVQVTISLYDLNASKKYLSIAESKLSKNDIQSKNHIIILKGLIELRQQNFLQAKDYFQSTSNNSEDWYKTIVNHGLIAAYLQLGLYDKAEQELDKLENSPYSGASLHILRIALASNRGKHSIAIKRAIKAQQLFPNDARFPAFLAHLHLLAGNNKKIKENIDKAISIAPDTAFVWHWLGLYYQGIDINYQMAIAAYEKAIQLNPNSMASWHNLSVIYLDQTEYDKAEKAINQAIQSAPHIAYPYATSALYYLSIDQLDKAAGQLKIALNIDPGEPNSLYAMSILKLLRGDSNAAIEWFEKTIVSNPDQVNATVRLGEAFYQSNRVKDAVKIIKTAKRLDENNPQPPMDLSLIAIDQAQAGDSIRYARESYEKFRTFGYTDFSGVRNIQNSASVTEFAYRQLQLNDWGNFFNQKSFSPYLPGGYFANSAQLATDLARRSSLIQGELLDPLSVSNRNRYYDFWRRPFNDITFSAGIGDDDGAFVDTQSFTFQGLSRSRPKAYRLDGTRLNNEGFRQNSKSNIESIKFRLGSAVDEKNALLFGISAIHNRSRLPGTSVRPTLDDSTEEYLYEGNLGYRLRISPSNYFLLRASGGYAQGVLKNDRPFGIGLSPLESSLLNSFDINTTNAFLQPGLCDIRDIAGVTRPVFLLDRAIPGLPISTCSIFGKNILQSTIPANIDLRETKSLNQKQIFFAFQFRHLFDVGSFQMTYGAEWLPSNIVSNREFTTFQPNNGEVATIGAVDPFLNFVTLANFPFGSEQLNKTRNKFNRDATFGYIKGRWTVSPDLWIEGSLHRRYYRNERFNFKQWDPAIGIAYQINSRQWLRATAQRNLYFDYQPDTVRINNQLQGSLAPTTTVGLASSNAYLTDGSSNKEIVVRWDSEWSPHFFTYVKLGERRIDRFLNILPVSNGRIRDVKTGLNIWFAEKFGFSSSYQYLDSENRSSSTHRDKELPLIAKHNFTASLNYIHPKQIRVSINQVFTSSRHADIANTEQLDDFWSTNIVLNWQPFDKHLSFNLAINNLFDKRSELIKNVPLVGRSVFFSIEGRY